MDFIIIEWYFNCTKRSCYLKKSYSDFYCKLDNANSPHPKFLFCKHCSRLNLLSSQYICIIISVCKEYILTNFLTICSKSSSTLSFPSNPNSNPSPNPVGYPFKIYPESDTSHLPRAKDHYLSSCLLQQPRLLPHLQTTLQRLV